MFAKPDNTWLSRGEGGTYVDILVTPGASNSTFKGVNEWRDCLEVAVEGRAREGRANKCLIQMFSKLLGVSKDRINITGGQRSRQKKIFVTGLTPESVLKKIREVIDS